MPSKLGGVSRRGVWRYFLVGALYGFLLAVVVVVGLRPLSLPLSQPLATRRSHNIQKIIPCVCSFLATLLSPPDHSK